MATNVDCSACSDLKEFAPDFVQNGVTKTVCNSLKNDTGLNPTLTTLHNDCDDLDTANDCLIGMMDKEIEAYDVCDWKEFMHKFLPNIHQLTKAEICAICGLWTNVHTLQCQVNYLYSGARFSIGESATDGSYVVAGKGVSFMEVVGDGEFKADVSMQYIAGGLGIMSGSCDFYRNDFTDVAECVNMDNGSTERTSRSRKGNTVWGTPGRPCAGGELVYEVRIKQSKFPQVKSIHNGFGIESVDGAFHARMFQFAGGSYAWGQHGTCNTDGTPGATGYDSGHLVPDGWLYIQCRMSYIMDMSTSEGSQYTPYMWFGIRTNRGEIDC